MAGCRVSSGEDAAGSGLVTRRSLIRSGLAALAAAPWAGPLAAAAGSARHSGGRARPAQEGEIVLGVSAAFSGPSRGLGTELYRGLAAVIVGGMSVSTVFTLLLLPSLLRIGEGRSRTVMDPARDAVTA